MNPASLVKWAGLPYHLSLVDAEPFADVLDHVRKSYPLRVVAEITGVSRYELTLISNRRRTRIRQETAAKLRDGLLSGPWWDLPGEEAS